MGKELIQGEVTLTIIGWKKLNTENEDSYEYKLKIICKELLSNC